MSRFARTWSISLAPRAGGDGCGGSRRIAGFDGIDLRLCGFGTPPFGGHDHAVERYHDLLDLPRIAPQRTNHLILCPQAVGIRLEVAGAEDEAALAVLLLAVRNPQTLDLLARDSNRPRPGPGVVAGPDDGTRGTTENHHSDHHSDEQEQEPTPE